ncbi:MAG: hypothetical protein LBK12_08035 [Odoribacteraceae bacterium]|jgi:hypothetical protein|nr:hypothetical protein [Odoribacteraceae bacterium]
MSLTATLTPAPALAGNPIKVNAFSTSRELVYVSVPVTDDFVYEASAMPNDFGECIFFINDLFADAFNFPVLPNTNTLVRLIPASARVINVSVKQGANTVSLTTTIYPGRVSKEAMRQMSDEEENIFDAKLMNRIVNFLMTSRAGNKIIQFRESEIEYIYFLRQDFDSITFKDLHGHAVDVPLPAGRGVIELNLKRVRYLLALQGSLAAYISLNINEVEILAFLLLPSADQRAELLFRNAWGVRERAELSGLVTAEPAFAAREAFNEYDKNTGNFSKREPRGQHARAFTIQSGYRNPGEIAFLADMLLTDDARLSVDGETIPVLVSGKIKRKHPLAAPTSVEAKFTARADESAITHLPPLGSKSYLYASADEIGLGAAGTTGVEIDVQSASPWHVASKDEWITTIEENETLRVIVGLNNTGMPRQGNIIIANNDGLTIKIIVLQGAAYINVSEDTLSFDGSGQPGVTITVDANVTWNITGISDWLVAVKENNGVLNVYARVNISGSAREGSITLASASGTASRTISVAQAAGYFFIQVEPASVSLPASGTPGAIVNVTANIEWYIHGKSDWLNISVSGNTLLITAQPNITASQRTGSVLLSDAGMGVFSPYITVTQAAYSPGTGITTDPGREDFGPQSYLNVSVTVNSELPWSVVSFPGWTNVTKFNDTLLAIDVEANDGPYRSGVIVLTNDENTVEFPLSQDGVAPGHPVLALEPDGSINEGDGSLVLDDIPARVAGYWTFDDLATGGQRGLDLTPAANDVPWHILVMELSVAHITGSGYLLSVPVGPGRRARFSTVDRTTVTLEIVQDGIVVHSEDMPVSDGFFTLTIGRVEGNLVAGVTGTTYSEALVGPWFIGKELDRRLYAGPNYDSDVIDPAATDVHVNYIELY